MFHVLRVFKMTSMLAATALLISACGGGGGSTSTPGGGNPVAATLSGTAAAGAPIIGSVTIKDSSSPAQTKIVQIAADGKYTVDVSDLKAPYMVRADGYVGGQDYHLYSAGTAADAGGTINITPLTDLIVANIAGSVAKTYFDNGSFSGLTAAQLTTQTAALKAKLLPVLQAAGVSDSIDLLRASFSADHTGLDAALDILKVTTDATTGEATIKNIITNQQITSTLATGSFSGTLTDTTGVATAVTDIQAISAGFKKFSDLFATSLPSETNATLLSLFDSATFMQGGQDLQAFLSEITTAKDIIGISFSNIAIRSMDAATGTALVGFDVIQNGIVSGDAPEAWYMIKKADGKWYMQGDKRIAETDITATAHAANASMSTGLELYIEDRGGKGITSAVVTGKGLPSQGVKLVNQINHEWFTIENNTYSGNFYAMDDTAISAIADSGEVYTVKLYTGDTLSATYTEKIKKRPYKNTELTAAMFPAITSPTTTELRAFTGGNVTVSWTLPAGLTNEWLDVYISDNAGNSAQIGSGLLAAERSKSFTLTAVTSTGQTFTPSNRNIWLGAWDGFGRKFFVSMY